MASNCEETQIANNSGENDDESDSELEPDEGKNDGSGPELDSAPDIRVLLQSRLPVLWSCGLSSILVVTSTGSSK